MARWGASPRPYMSKGSSQPMASSIRTRRPLSSYWRGALPIKWWRERASQGIQKFLMKCGYVAMSLAPAEFLMVGIAPIFRWWWMWWMGDGLWHCYTNIRFPIKWGAVWSYKYRVSQPSNSCAKGMWWLLFQPWSKRDFDLEKNIVDVAVLHAVAAHLNMFKEANPIISCDTKCICDWSNQHLGLGSPNKASQTRQHRATRQSLFSDPWRETCYSKRAFCKAGTLMPANCDRVIYFCHFPSLSLSLRIHI